MFGIGFPAWTGGALRFVYSRWVDAFCQRAAELAQAFGPGFALSPEVVQTLRQHELRY